jgi:hypothetical protein
VLKKFDPLEPPVAEQLGVVGRDDERRVIAEQPAQPRRLPDALADEV